MPKQLHMPSLDELPSNLPALIVTGLVGFGPSDELLRRQITSAVRLVNLSITEYELARSYLEESLQGGEVGFNAIFHATDHLELCVMTVHRALVSCLAVCRHGQMRSYLESRKEQTRLTRQQLEDFEQDQLGSVRNGITHISQWIAAGKISKGEPHVLSVSEDGRTATIGSCCLSLDDLSRSIKQLHKLAEGFSLSR